MDGIIFQDIAQMYLLSLSFYGPFFHLFFLWVALELLVVLDILQLSKENSQCYCLE
jgi:hypothetical protein